MRGLVESFSVVLREPRLAVGWTQERLARASGVSAHTIITLENGKRRPRLSTVAALADALEPGGPHRERLIAAARAAAAEAGDAGPAVSRIVAIGGWAYTELARRRPGAGALLLDEAEACTRRAVDLCDQAGDQGGKAYALNGLGKVLGNQGRYAEALDSYAAALVIYQAEGNQERVGSVHGNIGTIHFLAKRYDLALASYQRCLEMIDTPAADSYRISVAVGNIAEVHLLTGEYTKAYGYESRRLALAYGYTLHEAESLLYTGDIQSALDNTSEARRAPRATEARRRLASSAQV